MSFSSERFFGNAENVKVKNSEMFELEELVTLVKAHISGLTSKGSTFKLHVGKHSVYVVRALIEQLKTNGYSVEHYVSGDILVGLCENPDKAYSF